MTGSMAVKSAPRFRSTAGLTTTVRSIGWIEPVKLFSHLKPRAGFVWIDSAIGVQADEENRRFSYMMWAPSMILSGSQGRYTLRSKNGTAQRTGDPFDLIRGTLSMFNSRRDSDYPDFTGGAAGFFGYGLLTHCEPSTLMSIKKPRPEGDLWLGFYYDLIAFDHFRRETLLITNTENGEDPEPALNSLEMIAVNAEKTGVETGVYAAPSASPPTSDFTRDEYIQAVKNVQRYIERGDLYQANISQRFTVPSKSDPMELYIRLRSINPAPHSAYIDMGGARLLSSSPERFIRLHDGAVQSRPIKGTTARGSDLDRDTKALLELVSSEKDRAENIMIVDLMRNDLSKVCSPHSVSVKNLCQVEKFPTVFHLTSTVEGKLKPDVGVLELVRQTFPAGSVTGAPKIRAMEIIDEIEPDSRGAYCGSVGYIGFSGSSDLSVVIRTIVHADDSYSFSVGGAVTAYSVPEDEYQETLDKARALMDAIAG